MSDQLQIMMEQQIRDNVSYTQVYVSEKDMRKVHDLAKKRDAKKELYGAGRHGELTTSSEESHIRGLIGEIAICKYLNKRVDTKIYDTHGDDGFDIVTSKGRADIKTCHHPIAWTKPELKVPCQYKKDIVKLNGSDIFVLASARKDGYGYLVRLWGWATRQEVMSSKTKKYRNNGPNNFVMLPEQLKDISKLKEK